MAMSDADFARVLRSVNHPTAAQVARDAGLDPAAFRRWMAASWDGPRDGDGLRRAAAAAATHGVRRARRF
jgi:hypothetical protein